MLGAEPARRVPGEVIGLPVHASALTREGRGGRIAAVVTPGPAHERTLEAAPMMMMDCEGRRVLVLEDDERVRGAICDYLEELGYMAEPAANGHEAMRRFEKSAFRLVVADYKMPGQNGLDVVKQMRTLDPALRVLMVSGYASEFGWEARTLGIAVMPKPVDFGAFARVIEGITA
jgi:CheY-like chemotaxis protein